ncbi:MAG: hypothetical protein ACJAY8_001306 [Sphingobacteriales bacterium]|jgi:uncharacterized protein (TIGR02757 family)
MPNINFDEVKSFLDEKVDLYNRPNFIESDPIQIPHLFSKKEDIEISAFLTSTIAWGKREMIIKNATTMMDIMDNDPHEFILNYSGNPGISRFVHRTFNSDDLLTFFECLSHVYTNHGGLESAFASGIQNNNLQLAIHHFKHVFFEAPHLARTEKHVSDPNKGSAAKRLNMMLRWLVRKDKKGVDFGIWDSISPALLSCPLDVHSGNVARKLGLLTRKQNDAKALQELDKNLRLMDPQDPVKYDFALFGLGVFEGF